MTWIQEGNRHVREDGLQVVLDERSDDDATSLILYVSRAGVGIDLSLHQVVSRHLGDVDRQDCKRLWRELQRLHREGSVDLTQCSASVVVKIPRSKRSDEAVRDIVEDALKVLDHHLPLRGSDV